MTGLNSDISNTSGPGSTAEPSMEEILASIRRILREDERATAPVDLEDDVLVLDATMLAKAPDLGSATTLPAENDPASPDRAIPVASYQNEMHLVSEPLPMTEDFLVHNITPAASAEAAFAAPAPEPAAEPENFMAHEVNEPAPQVEVAAPAPVAQDDHQFTAPQNADMEPEMNSYERPDGLVGDDATEATKKSIGALVRSISNERVVAVSRGGITIEDIVREEIRPMLKAWLDTHLPTLVERIVRAEIERVVDRTQL